MERGPGPFVIRLSNLCSLPPPPFLPPPLLSPDIRLHPPTLRKKDSTFLEKNPLSAVIVGKHTVRVMVFIASRFKREKLGKVCFCDIISIPRSLLLFGGGGGVWWHGRLVLGIVLLLLRSGKSIGQPAPLCSYILIAAQEKPPISPVSSLPKNAFICMYGKGFWYSRQKCRALQERQCSFLFSPSGLKKVSRPSPCFPPSSPSRCM